MKWEIILVSYHDGINHYHHWYVLCSCCSVAITEKAANTLVLSDFLWEKIRHDVPKYSGITNTLEFRRLDEALLFNR